MLEPLEDIMSLISIFCYCMLRGLVSLVDWSVGRWISKIVKRNKACCL